MKRKRYTCNFTVVGAFDPDHRGAVQFLPPSAPEGSRPTLLPCRQSDGIAILPWSVAAHLIAMAKPIVPAYDLMSDNWTGLTGQLTADEAEVYCWLQHWATRQRAT